jgi:hypothetical protein
MKLPGFWTQKHFVYDLSRTEVVLNLVVSFGAGADPGVAPWATLLPRIAEVVALYN